MEAVTRYASHLSRPGSENPCMMQTFLGPQKRWEGWLESRSTFKTGMSREAIREAAERNREHFERDWAAHLEREAELYRRIGWRR